MIWTLEAMMIKRKKSTPVNDNTKSETDNQTKKNAKAENKDKDKDINDDDDKENFDIEEEDDDTVASMAKELYQIKNKDKEQFKRYSININAAAHKDPGNVGVAPQVVNRVEDKSASVPIAQDKPAETVALKDTPSALKAVQRVDTVSQIQDLQQNVHQLPQLHGYLEKKSGRRFGGWQKRWFIVKRTHLLWSKKEQYIENPLDITERRKFQNSLTLLQLSKVHAEEADKKTGSLS